MKTGWRGPLILGVILTSELSTAGAPEANLTITIHVNDYVQLDREVLTKAESEATGIFKKAGIQSQWIDPDSTEERSFPLSHIQLKILPSLMSDRLGLRIPDNAMGLAPGSGPHRQWVYVFYNRVETLAMKHAADTHAETPQILGHVFAHEIGHLLLNDQSHSATGIMRGVWNPWDLQNASYGYLTFTPRQAKVIREEVSRRLRQQELPAK